MEKIRTQDDLEIAILLLESKQAEDLEAVKAQVMITKESLKPLNILKSTFNEAFESENLKKSLLGTSVGLGIGYLTKKLFQNEENSSFKKVAGKTILFSLKNIVTKNPEIVKSLVFGILNMLGNTFKKNVYKSVKPDNVHKQVGNEPIDLETIY